MELEEDSLELAINSTKPVSIPIPTFPPTAAVCAVRPVVQEEHLLHRVNTVPMSLVAQAMLPPDDELSPRRHQRADVYICSVCRRCSSSVDGGSRPATLHVTSEEHTLQSNPGVHHARKSPTQPNLTLTRSWFSVRPICPVLVSQNYNVVTLECSFCVGRVFSFPRGF